MKELANPFIGYQNRDEKKSHNPYRFNPFTVLGISSAETDQKKLSERIKKLKFRIEMEETSDSERRLINITNAQRYLQEPLLRLAFELLVPGSYASKKTEVI